MKVPVCEASKRLSILYGRKKLFHWSPKEVKVFLELQADEFFEDVADLDLIEQYTAAQRAMKGGKGLHRRDLFTFLNNAYGERDRARDWANKNPSKVVRAASHDATPGLWADFISRVYPNAVEAGWQNAPASVKAEFKEWEKQQ